MKPVGVGAIRSETSSRVLPSATTPGSPGTLVAQGVSNRGIADTLVLVEHTVRRHVANILRKLGAPSRAAAAALAARHQQL